MMAVTQLPTLGVDDFPLRSAMQLLCLYTGEAGDGVSVHLEYGTRVVTVGLRAALCRLKGGLQLCFREGKAACKEKGSCHVAECVR